MEKEIILNDVQKEFYNKVINTPIEEFDLSPNIFISLLQTKFFTIYDFMDKPSDYLLNIRDFGFKEIEEVETKLQGKYYFFKLGMTSEELKKVIFNMPIDEVIIELNQDKQEKGKKYTLGNLK